MIHFINKNIPKKIIEECIKVYEDKDLFLKIDSRYYDLKENLLSKNKIQPKDFYDFINLSKGIGYTNFFYGKQLPNTNMNKMENIFIKDIKCKDYLYIGIKTFYSGIYLNFHEALKLHKDQKFLIIDLRNNFGGDVDECIKICNLLLPKCNIVEFRYKNRETIHKSDENKFDFKRIFLMVNNRTASCSEILTLTLKKHLSNVAILGNGTAGKFVGQSTFINKKYNYLFTISTFQWYVDNETTADLQKYIAIDNTKNIDFSKDDDYYSNIINFN